MYTSTIQSVRIFIMCAGAVSMTMAVPPNIAPPLYISPTAVDLNFLHIFKQFFNKINKLCYNSFTGWINMDVISMIDIPSNLEVADIKNSGGSSGGTETAAAFLSHFNGDKPWVHLDVQGRTDITIN